MKSFGFSRYASAMGAAAAMLAGCGGSQPPIGALGAMPQSSAIAQQASHGKSWMLPEAKHKDLLYVAGERGIDVYTYPKGRHVGRLNPGAFEAFGECVDATSDVFAVSIPYQSAKSSTIYEYAHGGTTPIATLTDPNWAFSCSIDPKTGNLAVAGNGVAVFTHASGNPTVYPYEAQFFYCGYDNDSNLYLSTENRSDPYYVLLVRLRRGSGSFEQIDLSQKAYFNVSWPSVEWDGKRMTISSQNTGPMSIYRLRIAGSNAQVVSSVELISNQDRYDGQLSIQGKSILGIYHRTGGWFIGNWPYPRGGTLRDTGRKLAASKNPYLFNGLVFSRSVSQ